MDPMYGLMSMEDIPEEKQKALAEMLRGQSSAGGRLATSSIAPVQEQGRLMQTSANTAATNIGLQNYRKRAAATAEARALADGANNGYKISPSERRAASQEAKDWKEQIGLLGTWTENKQTPLAGKAMGWAARKGVPMPKDLEEAASWWSQFRVWEGEARKNLFGSALTTTEKDAWDSTSINENMQPSLVQELIKLRQPVIYLKAGEAALLHMADGHNQDSLEAMYRNLVPLEALQSKEALLSFIEQTEQEVETISKRAAESKTGVQGMTDQDLIQKIQEGGL